MLTTIRKSGNSFMIIVPREEMQRVGVAVGEYVLVEIRPAEVRPRLRADLRDAVEAEIPLARDAFARLADG